MLRAFSAPNDHCPPELTDVLQQKTGSLAVFLPVTRTECVCTCFLTDQFINRPIMRTRTRVGVAPLVERLRVFGGQREYLCDVAAVLTYIC